MTHKMKVLFKQKMWTLLGRKYIVSVEGVKKYIIERVPFVIRPEYEIKDYKTWKVIGKIRNRIKLKADAIIAIGNKEFELIQEKWNEMVYHCTMKQQNVKYKIVGNHGAYVSTYKNSQQVGYWKKKSFVILSGNQFEMEINYDEDPILISAFSVLVDNYRLSVVIGGDIGWEFGNMGKGLTEFNQDWKPKKNRDNEETKCQTVH